jgi:hypothetical protein
VDLLLAWFCRLAFCASVVVVREIPDSKGE